MVLVVARPGGNALFRQTLLPRLDCGRDSCEAPQPHERVQAAQPVIVREALVADPPVLQAGEPVQTAAALLVKPHVETVLVADGERLVGVITKEAIVAAVADARDLRSLAAGDVADQDIPTVSPETSLGEALLLMAEQGLERLPVVEDGRLLGILPREPVVRRLAEDEPPPPPDEAA